MSFRDDPRADDVHNACPPIHRIRTSDKAHWSWACVHCNLTGVVRAALSKDKDTEARAHYFARRYHKQMAGCANECIRVDYIPDRATRMRLDESKTAARYDEIIKLRMLLLDVLEDLGEFTSGTTRMDHIEKLAQKWGKKGDCV